MRKYIYLIALVTILSIITGCSDKKDIAITSSDSKIYSHEELTGLSGEQLLNLFIENGLNINDDLKSNFTEDELQALFKTEFESLCTGVSTRDDAMYFDLAEQTKAIYDKIT